MRKFVSAVFIVLLIAGNTGLANAQPRGGDTLSDTVNFWELASVQSD